MFFWTLFTALVVVCFNGTPVYQESVTSNDRAGCREAKQAVRKAWQEFGASAGVKVEVFGSACKKEKFKLQAEEIDPEMGGN